MKSGIGFLSTYETIYLVFYQKWICILYHFPRKFIIMEFFHFTIKETVTLSVILLGNLLFCIKLDRLNNDRGKGSFKSYDTT